jgi:hypothetical protein
MCDCTVAITTLNLKVNDYLAIHLSTKMKYDLISFTVLTIQFFSNCQMDIGNQPMLKCLTKSMLKRKTKQKIVLCDCTFTPNFSSLGNQTVNQNVWPHSNYHDSEFKSQWKSIKVYENEWNHNTKYSYKMQCRFHILRNTRKCIPYISSLITFDMCETSLLLPLVMINF